MSERWWRRRPIPFIQSLQMNECGVACLAMTLNYHGRPTTLDEVRHVVPAGRDGADAYTLLEAGRWFGLSGRGVRVELEGLPFLEAGAILHWEFNHFVVFERWDGKVVRIVDPATGPRRVPMAKFRQSFTGVALLLEPGDGFRPTTNADHPLWRYLGQIFTEPQRLTRIAAVSALVQVFILGLPILTGALVDYVLPRGDDQLLWAVGAGLVAMTASYGLASWSRSHLLLQLRTLVDKRLTTGFMEHLVSLPYAFFQSRSTGDLIMRVASNATVREMLTAGALSGLLDGTLATIYLALILAVSPVMGSLVVGLGFLQVVVLLLTRHQYRQRSADALIAQARSQGYLVQILTGMETLKAAGAEYRAVEDWSHLFVDELNASLDKGRLSASTEALMSTIRMGAPLVILLAGGFQVLQGNLTLGAMLALHALAGGFLSPLSTLITTALQLHTVKSYLERIADVMNLPPEQEIQTVIPASRLRGAISVDGLSFRYSPIAPLALDGLSLEIQSGQFVAVVGRSGSGKSTLGKLLAGLYPPTAGVIYYDGTDLSRLDIRSVRRQIGVVPQQPALFGTSIRANIALTDPTLPLSSVIRAAKAAQIHNEIKAMAMGYETNLNDGGDSLSGGQRQRIALARALVNEPAVLLLDEATSALDTIAEQGIQEALSALQCTRIVIAQRLSTIARADMILVLEGGQIVERGTHAELLSRGGLYAGLVCAQSGGESASRAERPFLQQEKVPAQ